MNPVAGISNPTNATFEIADTKLYVSVVTLSIQDYNKLLEEIKAGLKRTIKWNTYRPQMSNHNKNNNLNYLHSVNLIDYLYCHLKMKMIEYVLVNILHLLLKLLTIMYWLMEKVFFDIPIKQQRKNSCKNY